jgi:hypothetical protein
MPGLALSPIGCKLLTAFMEAQLFWIEPVRAHQPGTLNVEPINLGMTVEKEGKN